MCIKILKRYEKKSKAWKFLENIEPLARHVTNLVCSLGSDQPLTKQREATGFIVFVSYLAIYRNILHLCTKLKRTVSISTTFVVALMSFSCDKSTFLPKTPI